jgi:hypothetical protein
MDAKERLEQAKRDKVEAITALDKEIESLKQQIEKKKDPRVFLGETVYCSGEPLTLIRINKNEYQLLTNNEVWHWEPIHWEGVSYKGVSLSAIRETYPNAKLEKTNG